MNISYNWLKEIIKTELEPQEIADKLTSIGLESSGVKEIESIRGGLKNFVIGRILEIQKHENSDHLSITKIDIGNNQEPLQIICGANNLQLGKAVVVALIGAQIFTDKETFSIKKSKIRGIESFGMLCSEKEIGIGNNNDGIIIIDNPNIKVGMPASEYFELSSDFSIEVDITPNRNDATSHYGVARDLAALLNFENSEYILSKPIVTNRSIGNTSVNINIENGDICPRFMGAVLKDIKVGDSPKWLKERLKVIGVSCINNVVDIANYILYELGLPIHCYDLDKTGNNIFVKKSKEQKFKALNGLEYQLGNDDIVVCDDNDNVLCLAGIIGGNDCSVTSETKNIFIEVANFNPTNIRKTAKRLGISTDSSFRFERGLDANACKLSMFRIIDMLSEYAEGSLQDNVFDYYPKKVAPFEVELSLSKLNDIAGKYISKTDVMKILTSLEIDIIEHLDDSLKLLIPPYRVDVKREIDVIEDILRIYGYNRIQANCQIIDNISTKTICDNRYRQSIVISEELVGQGFNEILCNSLTSSFLYERINSYPKNKLVKLLNPINKELDVVRQTLLFGGLQSISRNIRRQQKLFRFFEWGNVAHIGTDSTDNLSKYKEQNVLGLFIGGIKYNNSWVEKETEVSPFEIKSVVNNILNRIGFEKKEINENLVDFDIFSNKCLEISKSDGDILARLGKVSKDICKLMDIDITIYYAEIYCDNVLCHSLEQEICISDIPKYPVVKRDLSLLIDKSITFRDISQCAYKTDKKYLVNVELFDVYEGENIPNDKKSYAISFYLSDQSKTMNDNEIDSIMNKIQKNLMTNLSAELR